MIITPIFVALLVMANGQNISARMESAQACTTFTRAIALHVESADCESYAEIDMSGDGDYFPPEYR